MRVDTECGTCGKGIAGYQDQGSPKVWDKPKGSPETREAIAVHTVADGGAGYMCLHCWHKVHQPPEKVQGLAYWHATKQASISFQPKDAQGTEGVVTHTFSAADALRIVEWLAEQGVVKPFVVFEADGAE